MTASAHDGTNRVWWLVAAVTALTLFDAVASWSSIARLRVAAEGNGLLDMLAGVIGFEGALVVRFVWGVGLTLVLAHLAFVQFRRDPGRRPLAYRGLWVVTGVLSLLAVWHVVVLAVGAS